MSAAEMVRSFDKYALNAQLKPGILAVFPVLMSIIDCYRTDFWAAKDIVALLVAAGGTLALAQYARSQGRLVEPNLFESWGGDALGSLAETSRPIAGCLYQKKIFCFFGKENLKLEGADIRAGEFRSCGS